MSTFLLGLRYAVLDVFWAIIRWPLWWYSKGLVLIFGWVRDAIVGYARTLAIWVWVKNIFVPMFGQRDWQSRLISFFMRVVQIIMRSMAIMIFAILALLGVVVYVGILPVAGYFVLFHLGGVL